MQLVLNNNDQVSTVNQNFKENCYITNTLIKVSHYLQNPPDFTNKAVLSAWINELDKLPREIVVECFKNLKKRIDTGKIVFFPKISEFLTYSIPDFDDEIEHDVARLYTAILYPSTLSIYLLKDKARLSDIAFYYLKTEFNKLEKFQYYIADFKYKDKIQQSIKDKLKKLYLLHHKSADFKNEVTELQFYTSQKIEQNKLEKEQRELEQVITEKEYEERLRIIQELKKSMNIL